MGLWREVERLCKSAEQRLDSGRRAGEQGSNSAGDGGETESTSASPTLAPQQSRRSTSVNRTQHEER